MKTIWIVNYYAASPATTGNHRHFEFAKHLTAAGYRVRVFSAGFLFTKGIDLVPKDQKYYNTEYDVIFFNVLLSCFEFPQHECFLVYYRTKKARQKRFSVLF